MRGVIDISGSSVYSENSGNLAYTPRLRPESWEPAWFRQFLKDSLARLEGSGGEEQLWDNKDLPVQRNSDRKTPTVVTRSAELVDIPLRVSLGDVMEDEAPEGSGSVGTREPPRLKNGVEEED